MATDAEQVLGSRSEASARWLRALLSAGGIVAQLAPFALAFAVYLAVFLVMRPESTGDEPHYLLIAESIAYDGDVDVTNDYASRERTLRVTSQFPLPQVYQARIYTESGDLRPLHGVGLGAVLAPAVAFWGLTGARIAMLLIAALLADQLFRLLRDLRFRLRYRVLAWASVVFCLPGPSVREPGLPRATWRFVGRGLAANHYPRSTVTSGAGVRISRCSRARVAPCALPPAVARGASRARHRCLLRFA